MWLTFLPVCRHESKPVGDCNCGNSWMEPDQEKDRLLRLRNQEQIEDDVTLIAEKRRRIENFVAQPVN
jgi:hypothetical protein